MNKFEYFCTARCNKILSCILLNIVLIFNLKADNVSESKTLFSQGKYEEAEKKIASELQKSSPSPKALEVGIELSIKQGKYITASKYLALLVKTNANDANILYKAGYIAVLSGKLTDATSYYKKFIKLSNAKSEKMKIALEFLIINDISAEAYTKYIELFGANSSSWNIGLVLLKKLSDSRRTKDMLEVYNIAFQKFGNKSNQAAKLAESLARDIQGMSEYGEVVKLISSYKIPNQQSLSMILSRVWRDISSQQRVEVLINIQKINNVVLSESILKYCLELQRLSSEDEKLKYGKEFIQFEKLYRNSLQEYMNYTRIIFQSPQVFNIEGKELVNANKVIQMFDALKTKYNGDTGFYIFDEHITNLSSKYLKNNPTENASFLEQNIKLLSPKNFKKLVDLTEGKKITQQLSSYKKTHSYGYEVQVNWALLEWYNKLNKKDLLLRSAEEYMTLNVGDWDSSNLYKNVIQSGVCDEKEIFKLLNQILRLGGTSSSFTKLIKSMERSWKKNKSFTTLKKEVAQNKSGSNSLASTYVMLTEATSKRNYNIQKVTEIVNGFLEKNKAPIPSGWEFVKEKKSYIVYAIFNTQAKHGNRRGELNVWINSISGTGEVWKQMLTYTKNDETRGEIVAKYMKEVESGKSINPLLPSTLCNVVNPKGIEKSLFTNNYIDMQEYGLNYINYQSRTLPVSLYLTELEKAMKVIGATAISKSNIASIASNLYSLTDKDVPPTVNMMNLLFSGLKQSVATNGVYDLKTESLLCLTAIKSLPKSDALTYLDKYIAWCKSRTSTEQANAIMSIFNFGTISDNDIIKNLLLVKLSGIIPSISSQDWAGVTIYGNIFDNLVRLSGSENLQKVLMKGLANSAQLQGNVGTGLISIIPNVLCDLLAKKQLDETMKYFPVSVSAITQNRQWSTSYSTAVTPVVEKLKALNKNEMIYIFANLISKNVIYDRENALKQLSLLKAEALRDVPVLTVDKSDPAYNLHLASQALALKNELQAWELTNNSLSILTTKWTELDINYVAWVIEQMRKQKMLKESLEFCFTILTREFDLDAEIVAKISIIKGDIYRDMSNYQAARIEYQGILNNKRYKNTESKIEAEYRLIELLIATKDYASAENKLERMTDAGSIKEQAGAYYLLAIVAFEQQEYKLSRERLDQVFKRINDHVKSRLLEGELRLLLPRGLSSTEVAIGNPKLKTVVIPGNDLTLKLQDSNLSIIRGGKAIPILLTTSEGGDVETLNLVQSSDDENLFTAKIMTGLGNAKKNNLKLEVLGIDKVLYEISPEFQKANDLNYPPKTLIVKASAELIASAGQILTKEEQEKKDMQKKMQEAIGELESRRFEGRDGTTVRPGSPIYIQVTDFDRDVSGDKDTITLDIASSSGGTLPNYTLQETEVHSGIFEAVVPTSIPQPKVNTSDGEEGNNPNVVIDPNNKKTWDSLSSSDKPKWIEVDTMNSKHIGKVTLELPNVSSIKSIKLVGGLNKKEKVIAVFPENKHIVKGGMKIRAKADNQNVDVNSIRQHVKGVNESSSTIPVFDRNNTKWKGRSNWVSAQATGLFWVDEPREFEFKLLQDKPSKNQTAYIFIDNEQILGGTTYKVQRNTRSILLSKGLHSLEILVNDRSTKSQVILGYNDGNNNFIPLSEKFFSISKNPELKEILKPNEKMMKTGDGFSVFFSNPTRYRTLRWVFEDFSGSSVSVKSITVADKNSKMIVPLSGNGSNGNSNFLKLAPGDQISVAYQDEMRLNQNMPILSAELDAAFYDGDVTLTFEDIQTNDKGGTDIVYSQVKRIRIGDQLMIAVTDYDEDLTEDRDEVNVNVKTSSGESLKLKLLETAMLVKGKSNIDDYHRHAGTFLQTIKFGQKTGNGSIKVKDGDTITIAFLDKENTEPGVPIERTYVVGVVNQVKPEMIIFATRIELVEDKTDDAKRQIWRLKQKGEKREDIKIYKEQIIAEKIK